MRKTKDTRIYTCCEKIPTFAAIIPLPARLKEKRFSMRTRRREQLFQPSCARDKRFAYFSRSHYFLFECVKPRIHTCFAQPSPFCSHTSKPGIPLPARDNGYRKSFFYTELSLLKEKREGYKKRYVL